MADTVTAKWLYPPNWDGYYPTNQGHKRYVKMLTNISDATGETNVRKITVADHLTTEGKQATKLVLEKISCIGYGLTSIVLNFDVASKEVAAVLPDTYEVVFPGGGVSTSDEEGTGDLLLTTNGAASGSSYALIITYRVK